jgi:hypothetical protein
VVDPADFDDPSPTVGFRRLGRPASEATMLRSRPDAAMSSMTVPRVNTVPLVTEPDPTARLRAEIRALADAADRVVFSPGDPTVTDVTDYWDRVDAVRADLRRRLGRWRRVQVAFSLRSLRRPVRGPVRADKGFAS